jgi:DNA repair exonuclease SbcCD nuclease subunit
MVGDLHIKSTLSYNDYVKGGRGQEEQEVLDFIVEQSKDCGSVVLLGDNLNSKNNSAEVVRKFTEFVERFENKTLYIISGNHDKHPNGEAAFDYLKEVKNKQWHIVTNEVKEINKLVFCPYFTKNELDCKTNEDASKKLLKMFPEGEALFVHHAIAGSKSKETPVSIFDEIVLSKEKLEKKYKKIFAGHIHSPQAMGNIIIAGSIFSGEINEKEKFVWKLDLDTFAVEQIKLPGRPIVGLENPTMGDLEALPKNSIVKITITDKEKKKEIDALKERLEGFDAGILVENIATERKKLHTDQNIIDLDVEGLLRLYAEQKKIEFSSLLNAFNLIK